MYIYLWHVVGHSFLWVGVSANQRNPFVCFDPNITQRVCGRDYQRDRKRTREGRSQREQKKPVDRTGQSAGESSHQKSGEVEGWKRRLLGSLDSDVELANVRGWVSVPGGFVRISLVYTFAIAHRCTESYTKVSQTSSFLRLELTQVHVCLLSFLPPSRLCMLYSMFFKEIWSSPGRRWEKPLNDRMAMIGLGGWDSGVSQRVYCCIF